MKTRRVKTRGERGQMVMQTEGRAWSTFHLEPSETLIDAIKKRLQSWHRGTGGKAVNGRCFRAVTLPHSQTQTPNFTATQSRCGSRLQDGEDVPNGATLRRGAAVRDTCAELFDSVDCIIGTKGRKMNERGLPPRRARSGQRGKRSREYDRSTKSR